MHDVQRVSRRQHQKPDLHSSLPAPAVTSLVREVRTTVRFAQANHPDSHRRFRRVLRIALVCKALAPNLNPQDQEALEKQLSKIGDIGAQKLESEANSKSEDNDDRELDEHYEALGQLDEACCKLFGPEYTSEDLLSLPIFEQQ